MAAPFTNRNCELRERSSLNKTSKWESQDSSLLLPLSWLEGISRSTVLHLATSQCLTVIDSTIANRILAEIPWARP